MKNKQKARRRFAAVFGLMLLALAPGALGAQDVVPVGVAQADEAEPDFLVLNPEGE